MKKNILKLILRIIAKKINNIYSPKIIAITGSVGKTSAKNAVSFYLQNFFTTRGSAGNLNNELGLPLVFIGRSEGGQGSIFSWIKIIISGIKLIIKKNKNYPEIIVAEMGADKLGDISYLTEIAKPDISVITFIGDAPSHLENYKNIDELVEEKHKITAFSEVNDFTILNFDDPRVIKVKSRIKSKIITFGFNEGADIRIFDFKYQNKNMFSMPYGILFTLRYKDSSTIIHLPYCLGKPFAYSVAVSVACGIALGIDIEKAKDIFRELRPEPGRLNLIEGKDNYFIIDDTYNASPASVQAALEVLSEINVDRRVAVLGDMKELGDNSVDSHRSIGQMVANNCDILITVGDQASYIKEEALKLGMSLENVYHYSNSWDAGKKIKDMIIPGDMVLVKGSRSMKMENVVDMIKKKE